jgi:hypothetical protein
VRARSAEPGQDRYAVPGRVHRWLQTWRTEGRREAKPHAGGPAPRLNQAALDKLAAIVAEANDLSLAAYAAKLRERDGKRPDHMPGAAEARPAPQKRACGRRSRTDPTSSPPAPHGGSSWPSSSHGS